MGSCRSRSRAAGMPCVLVLSAVFAVAAGTRAESLAGHEIWFAWPATPDVTVDEPTYDLDAELILLAPEGPVDVQVTGPGLDLVAHAEPGRPASVRVNRAAAMVTVVDVPTSQGIHLEALGCTPFAAYFRVPGSGHSVGDDMTRLIPVALLGRRILPVAYWGEAGFTVTATQDDTTVTIDDPHCSSVGPVILQRGEAIHHRCDNADDERDISGTVVDASAPVAVVCASSSRVIRHVFTPPGGSPAEFFFSYEDVLLESPWPVELLGRTHVHVPFRWEADDASGDLLRVVAGCPDNAFVATEGDGRAWDADLPVVGSYDDVESWNPLLRTTVLIDSGTLVESIGAVQVAAYTVGSAGPGAAGMGDPSMTLLDPVELWERRWLAWLPDGYESSIGIAAPVGATDTVRLDGVAPLGTWQPVGDGTRFAWLRLDRVAAGEHAIQAAEPIAVVASGYGPTVPPDHPLRPGAWSSGAIPLREDGLASLLVATDRPCDDPCPGECVSLSLDADVLEATWSDGESGVVRDACPDEVGPLEVAVRLASGCDAHGRRWVQLADPPEPITIDGPTAVCFGGCVTLTALGGHDEYAWSTGEGGASIAPCPLRDTLYTVIGTDLATGCTVESSVTVEIVFPPRAGPVQVAALGRCARGLEVTWAPATWRAGSPGGVYHVFRREGGCALPSDPSWEIVAADLVTLAIVDTTARVGIAYSYLVESEDAPIAAACALGRNGAPAAWACGQPEAVTDTGDPDAPLLVSLSPYLRALGFERDRLGGPATAVTFSWMGAPGVDPATRVDVYRSDRAQPLWPHASSLPGDQWRDPDPTSSRLLFYRVYNVTDCGTHGD